MYRFVNPRKATPTRDPSSAESASWLQKTSERAGPGPRFRPPANDSFWSPLVFKGCKTLPLNKIPASRHSFPGNIRHTSPSIKHCTRWFGPSQPGLLCTTQHSVQPPQYITAPPSNPARAGRSHPLRAARRTATTDGPAKVNSTRRSISPTLQPPVSTVVMAANHHETNIRCSCEGTPSTRPRGPGP
jgi:hypothetical protein